MDKNLKRKHCVPCHNKNIQPFERNAAEKYLSEIVGWTLSEMDGHLMIKKEFIFKPIERGFEKALQFVNKVGRIAEDEGHHPDIHIHYHKVILEFWTHAIGGLSENDFIMAAKIDELLAPNN